MATRQQPLPVLPAGPFRAYVESFDITLESEGKAPKTRRTYTDAATRCAGWLLASTEHTDWATVDRDALRHYFAAFLVDYSATYANNQFRALQQFWKWYADEEQTPNPMAGMKAPQPEEKLVPVIEPETMAALLKDAEANRTVKGKPGKFCLPRFIALRDTAILRLFASTGCRLAEVAGLTLDDLDVRGRSATVVGKGSRPRSVRFDARCAQALDRYLRIRGSHPAASGVQVLWLGHQRASAMTASGVYQMIERRAKHLGLRIHPHMFRHTFAHNYLDGGGAEGDLMAQAGWRSPTMLRHYGASAKAARAARAYDRIDVMKGV